MLHSTLIRLSILGPIVIMYWANDNLEFNVKSKSKRYWKIVLDMLTYWSF